MIKLNTKLFFIKFSIIFYFLNSCGTYDYIASGFSSEEEAVEEISNAEDELKADLQDYVDSVMEMLGEDPRPEDRTFHVTVANLTGKSSDSVA